MVMVVVWLYCDVVVLFCVLEHASAMHDSSWVKWFLMWEFATNDNESNLC